jgi:SAM-dependent methyltransferase
MAGGLDAALSRGEAEVEAICQNLSSEITVVDLGAGFGMHTIPLARRGCSVLAVDTSSLLLETLRAHAEGLLVRIVEDDLMSFRRHFGSKADLFLCMGDTLTHLSDAASVERLFALVAESLHPGGMFIITFRDYTSPLVCEERFISVKSDTDRILTCFLEYEPDWVNVHDVLHERNELAWQLRVSTYRKLRLSPSRVSELLQANGFSVRVEPGFAGMLRMVATNSA